jgi:hypothetical protein
MTSQGTAHGRFQRAIQRRHLLTAETAARELGGLNLAEALDLTLLMRETDLWRYERAAVRWLQRFIEEHSPTLAELASAALAEVGGAGDGSLRDLLRAAGSRGALKNPGCERRACVVPRMASRREGVGRRQSPPPPPTPLPEPVMPIPWRVRVTRSETEGAVQSKNRVGVNRQGLLPARLVGLRKR